MKQWTPEEIRKFRKKLNLYQKDFALMVGVSARYIIYLEQGVRKPGKGMRLFFDCLEREAERQRKEVKHGKGNLQKKKL
jgi:predicted transcriptional regulator